MASKNKGGQGSQKSFLALPRLRAGHGIQMPVNYEWTANDHALQYISQNIDVQNSGEKGHSIPDIFSQSIQFEFDLGIGNGDAVGQWQGLLATLLLAGAGGQLRIRELIPSAMPDSPFTRIFKAVAARRGIRSLTLFELRKKDGGYSAVAFRYDGMPTMLCPAAEIYGPFAVEDPWIVKAERGYAFTTPFALVDDARYDERRLALRNEIYALATRIIPAKENRDGLQLSRLQEYYELLNRGKDGISGHPIHAEVRQLLYTFDPDGLPAASEVFTDRICLFREGDAYNHLHAGASETMRIFSGGTPTEWRALLPLRRDFAREHLSRLRGGLLHLRMQWHNGAVDVALLNESDAELEAKRYRIQDLINYTRHRSAPQIAVWPPKALSGWSRYYLLRYDDGNALPLKTHVLGVGDTTEDVTLLSQMPQCLSFSLDGAEVGLLLPEFETAQNTKTKEFNVGFDFGTTGTTAYKHDPATGVTTPVSFSNQGALFLFGRKEGADVSLTAQFISERIAERATHYSLLRRKVEKPQEGGALLQTTVPLLLHGSGFNPEILRDVSDDLKWGSLAADKLRANLFLEQYLMMCLWHIVTNGAAAIHWRASYPLSMQGRLQEDYVAKIQTIVSGLCAHCYRIPYDTSFCSESEAVGFMMMDNDIQARYLKGQTVNEETGFFCLDIGGGSTDLSLWLHRRPLMQASLRWAGNAILGDTVTRENHGEERPVRENLLDYFFLPGTGEGKRLALATPLLTGEFDEFRRVWNVLIDEVTDAIKGVHRGNEPLSNYLNIVRLNLYMLFYFGGRMVGEAIAEGTRVGLDGTPLPVAVLGNGAKMMKLLYNDVEVVQQPLSDGSVSFLAQERQNPTRYQEEMARLSRAFCAGCGVEGFSATIIEPFMPKQETARGLAIAPEAFLSQRATQRDEHHGGWPQQSAYALDKRGVVQQAMTEDYRALAAGSFDALRYVFGDDDSFREFLASLFSAPDGADRFSLQGYYDSVWAQCLRHNPEPMLPGQPLPQKDTIAGRFVEMLSAINRMTRTA